MYYLDFITIIRLLKEFRRSGVLRTELPRGVINTQGTYWLQLKLLQGEITDCQVIASQGETMVADQNMLDKVERLGPLEWTFSPLKKSSDLLTNTSDYSATSGYLPAVSPSSLNRSSSSSRPAPSLPALIPRRVATVEQRSLSILTRQQRRVLALVDGKRNIGQIVALLFSPANIKNGMQEVFTLLQELEVQQIITLR